MQMKKIVSMMLCCSMLTVMFTQSSFAADFKTSVIEEEKKYSQVSVTDDFKPGELLVVLKKNKSELNKKVSKNLFSTVHAKAVEDLTALSDNYDASLVNNEDFHQILRVVLPSTDKTDTYNAMKKIEQLDDVLSVEPNVTITLDDVVEEDPAPTKPNNSATPDSTLDNFNLNTEYQYGLHTINAVNVWYQTTTGDRSVKVGVMDSGIDSTHPDLVGNVNTALSRNFTDDGLGLTDTLGHGTHVAGIIGATGTQMAYGVCPKVTMVSLKVFKTVNNKGNTNSAWIASAINYAQQQGIKILNCSGGFSSQYEVIKTAINNYSGILVASAGNDALNTDVTGHYPASYTNSNIIAVAASDSNNQLRSSSNYGVTSVDLAAPGTGIVSTYLNHQTKSLSGTSMAAPFVTGTVALLKAHYPNITNDQIKTCILAGVTPASALSGKVATGGILNVAQAFNNAIATVTTNNKIISGDFNGDGLDELMCIANIGSSHTRFLVNSSYTDGFSGWYTWMESTGIQPNCYGNRFDAGDVNNDGFDDIVAMYRYPSGDTKLFVYLSDGGSFSGAHEWGSWAAADYNANNVGERFVVGDFNGDSKADAAVIYQYPNKETKIFTYISTGSSFSGSANWRDWPAGAYDVSCIGDRFVAGDFNGDGKDDLAVLYQYTPAHPANIFVYLSTGSSFGNANWRSWPAGAYSVNCVNGRFTTGDFNGDGKDDLSVMYYADSTTCIHTYLSTGSSFTVNIWNTFVKGAYNADCVGKRFVGGNFTGDAKDDVASVYFYPSGNVWILEQTSTGSSFSNTERWL